MSPVNPLNMLVTTYQYLNIVILTLNSAGRLVFYSRRCVFSVRHRLMFYFIGLSILKNFQIGLGVHSVSSSVHAGSLSQG